MNMMKTLFLIVSLSLMSNTLCSRNNDDYTIEKNYYNNGDYKTVLSYF